MADEKKDDAGKKGKKGVKKYTWFIVGGIAFVIILIYVAMKKGSGSSGSSSTTAANTGVDPATGYLYGSPADLAALNGASSSGSSYQSGSGLAGATGPAGPAGPAGPPGPAGPTGGTTPPKPPAVAHPGPGPVKGPFPTAPLKAAAATTSYTVKSGDSLWKIAQRFYGNGAQYTKIYNANRGLIGSNPNMIHPGQRLTIPH